MASVTHSSPRSRGKPQRSPRQRSHLRVAVFADGSSQPRWLVDALAAVADSDFAEIVLVAVTEKVTDRQRRQTKLPWLWRAYRHADRLFFARGDDPSAPAELRSAAPQAAYLGYEQPPAGHAPAWRSVVAAMPPLDVIFVLGDLDDAEFEDSARYGVWRYCFGEANDPREALAGLREVAGGAPVTCAGLSVSLWPGVRRLLYQSTSRTYPLSVARNRANLLNKAALFAERELRQLHRQGMARLRTPGAALPAAVPAAGEHGPGLGETLGGLFAIGGRILQRAWQKLACVDQWSIAFRFGPPGWESDLDLAAYTRLLPATDRIWADPFPYERNGRHYIFFEEVPLAIGKGHISVIEVHADGTHSAPRKILEEDYHLSYPFLIEDQGHLYMVPESGQNRSVELYRCQHFPDLWHREKVLLDKVACADATFHRDAERWWMFVNIGAPGTELYDELHLYYADSLTGKWRPHPANPIKSDVCSARPAGRLFMRNGFLHRPAQICAPRYGTGIAIAQVLELTPQTYREEIVDRILPLPGQGILGLHTLNRAGDLNVIDCFARRSRF